MFTFTNPRKPLKHADMTNIHPGTRETYYLLTVLQQSLHMFAFMHGREVAIVVEVAMVTIMRVWYSPP